MPDPRDILSIKLVGEIDESKLQQNTELRYSKSKLIFFVLYLSMLTVSILMIMNSQKMMIGILQFVYALSGIIVLTISKYSVEINQNDFDTFRNKVIETRKLDNNWKKSIDEMIDTVSNSTEENQFVIIYRKILSNQILIWNDIKVDVDSFIDSRTRRVALSNGFHNQLVFDKAETAGCDTISEYNLLINSGFNHFEEYKTALKHGFTTVIDWETAKSKGVSSIDELLELKQSGYKTKKDYEYAKLHGFRCFEDHREANDKGFKSKYNWDLAQKHEIPDKLTFEKMITFGFSIEMMESISEKLFLSYKTYNNLGYSSVTEYDEAIELGFVDYIEYSKAKKLNFPDKKTYDDVCSKGFPDYNTFLKSTELGFVIYSNFKDAMDRKCTDKIQWDALNLSKFKTFNEYQHALTLGCENFDEYRLLIKSNSPDMASYLKMSSRNFVLYSNYEDATAKGFTDPEEFQLSIKHQIIDKEQFDKLIQYKIYKEIMREEDCILGLIYHESIELGFPDYDIYNNSKLISALNYEEYKLLVRKDKTRHDYLKELGKLFDQLLLECAHLNERVNSILSIDELNSFVKITAEYQKTIKLEGEMFELKNALPIRDDWLIDYTDIAIKTLDTVDSLEKFCDDKFNNLQELYEYILLIINNIRIHNNGDVINITKLLDISGDKLESIIDYFNSYFPNSLNRQGELYQIISWVGLPEDYKRINQNVMRIVSSLKTKEILSLHRLKEKSKYPGSQKQFDQLINDLDIDRNLITLNFEDGIILKNENSDTSSIVSYEEIKDDVIKILEETARSNENTNISYIALKLGKERNPEFIDVVKEIIHEEKIFSFNDITGNIKLSINKQIYMCPICFRNIKEGEGIGVCPHTDCKQVFHKREILDKALHNRMCPACKKELKYDDVYTFTY